MSCSAIPPLTSSQYTKKATQKVAITSSIQFPLKEIRAAGLFNRVAWCISSSYREERESWWEMFCGVKGQHPTQNPVWCYLMWSHNGYIIWCPSDLPTRQGKPTGNINRCMHFTLWILYIKKKQEQGSFSLLVVTALKKIVFLLSSLPFSFLKSKCSDFQD